MPSLNTLFGTGLNQLSNTEVALIRLSKYEAKALVAPPKE